MIQRKDGITRETKHTSARNPTVLSPKSPKGKGTSPMQMDRSPNGEKVVCQDGEMVQLAKRGELGAGEGKSGAVHGGIFFLSKLWKSPVDR